MSPALRPRGSAARAALVALLSSISIIAVVWRTPQGLYSDPSWQLRAAQQFDQGRSPTINTLVQPADADLARDRGEWILWWAPGTQLATYPLMRSGLSVGTAVRLVAAVCLVLGAVGWALWFAQFHLPRPLGLVLAAAFPWVRYASNALFLFSAEALTFAAIPWLLLAGLWLVRAARAETRTTALPALSLVVGLALGTSYVLKYSAFLSAVGIVAFVATSLVLPAVIARVLGPSARAALPPDVRGGRELGRRAWVVACCVAGAAAPVLALSLFNRSRGAAANLVTASAGLNPSWEHVARGILNPVLAVADAEAVLKFSFMHPARPLVTSDHVLMLAALPGAAVLYWVLGGTLRRWRRPQADDEPGWTDARVLALTCFTASAVALVLTWFVSQGASYEARHLAAGSFALLPLILTAGAAEWRARGPVARIALASAGVIYVALPLGYGAAATVGKVRRSPAGYRVGRAGISNQLLASRDVAACATSATIGFDSTRDVWYLPEPMTALELPGRAIVVDADFSSLEQLERRRFRSSRPVHVRVLLPPTFEHDDKGRVIRASFEGAVEWTRTELPACRYAAWDAVLPGAGSAAPPGPTPPSTPQSGRGGVGATWAP